jgi:hypothetical protein
MMRAGEIVHFYVAMLVAQDPYLAPQDYHAVAAAADPERAGKAGDQIGQIAGAVTGEREDGAIEGNPLPSRSQTA